MKKILILFFILLWQNPYVFAQNDVINPYQLSTHLPQDEVTADECIQYIREGVNNIDQETNDLRKAELTESLNFYYEEFFRLNELITELEIGETNSLHYGETQLNQIYDQILMELSEDEEFLILNEEEQVFMMNGYPEVIEWQEYLNQIQETIEQTILERDLVEGEYQRINYDLENLNAFSSANQDELGLVNQCLLLPYSVDYLSEGSYLLDSQNNNFSELLYNIDSILKQLVPSAYQKVTFQQIYDTFNKSNATNEDQSDKFPEVFDINSLDTYHFQQDLNLNNLKKIAKQANTEVQQSAEQISFQEIYQAILHTKEEQFRYFQAINIEAWAHVKNTLADYLNDNHLLSEEVIAQIQQLHDRYQVKLILFDEIGQVWQPVEAYRSGYLEKYYHLAFEEQLRVNETQHESTEETETDQTFLSEYSTEAKIKSEEIEDKLSKIKNQLTSKNNKSNRKNLTPKEEKTSKESGTTKNTKNAPLKLPSTGEQWTLTILAIMLLLIGLLLLLVNRKIKKKNQKNPNEIDLF